MRTILLNSNPATIMTDPGVADVVYLEPLTVESVERILERERPDGILAGLGGQTALNLAIDVARAGAARAVRRRGSWARRSRPSRWPRTASAFRDLLDRIGQPYAPSVIVEGATRGEREAATATPCAEIGLPAVIRPAFTLGGTGGGIVRHREPTTASACAPACAPAPSARSWSSATWSAGRRSSTR